MSQDSNDRRGGDPTADALGQAASAAAGAGSEFLARALELSGRQIADAIVQALKPSGTGEDVGRIDSLLSRYRDALGELALHLPMVARRLVQVYEEPPGSAHWLFRATLEEPTAEALNSSAGERVSAMPVLAALEDFTPQETGSVIRTFMTDEPLSAFSEAFLNTFRTGPIATRKKRLDALKQAKEHAFVRKIPELLDQLKYDFRRDGVPALARVLRAIDTLRGRDLVAVFEFIDSLKSTLGENCARELFGEDVFAKLTEEPEPLQKEPFGKIKDAFQFAGIDLSNNASVIAERTRWLVLDHANDRIFEARRRVARRASTPLAGGAGSAGGKIDPNQSCVDIYGPVRCPYRATWVANRVMLPVRVADASHGIAVWSVDRQLVQEHLEACGQGRLRAWNIGDGRTLLALFMTAHREGDLGPYRELGLMCFVTPRKDPLAVGMIAVHDILATDGLGLLASNEIWAARKVPTILEFKPRDRSATMTATSPNGKPLVRVTMPRGGEGTSSNVPLFLYTYKGEILHRTIITRSGAGESMRAGGLGLEVEISEAGREVSLCDDLRYFGIAGEKSEPLRRPLFTAWSEHVLAELPRPNPVHERDDED